MLAALPPMRRARVSSAVVPLFLCVVFAARAGAVSGGSQAPPGSFPFMAFVADVPPNGSEVFCSGTVLAPNVVLTAAHCATDIPANYEVVTGSLDRTNQRARQVSGVSQIVVNPGYTSKSAQYDAALLVLSTPTTAPSIRLAADPQDQGLVNAGTRARVAGWGLMAHQIAPRFLRSAPTVLQTNAICQLAASLLLGGLRYSAKDQVCVASSGGRDSICNGDSGGPLLASDAAGEVEIGIAHETSSDCDGHVPQYFIRADAISAWASSEISSLEAARPTGSATTTTPATPTTSPLPLPIQVIPGLYQGWTSQNRRVQARISALSSPRLTSLTFHFKYHCSRARTLLWWVEPLSTGGFPADGLRNWSLNAAGGVGFDRVFVGASGGRYSIRGSFTATGTVSGKFRSSWHSPTDGFCSSGLVKWSARL